MQVDEQGKVYFSAFFVEHISINSIAWGVFKWRKNFYIEGRGIGHNFRNDLAHLSNEIERKPGIPLIAQLLWIFIIYLRRFWRHAVGVEMIQQSLKQLDRILKDYTQRKNLSCVTLQRTKRACNRARDFTFYKRLLQRKNGTRCTCWINYWTYKNTTRKISGLK